MNKKTIKIKITRTIIRTIKIKRTRKEHDKKKIRNKEIYK